VKDGQNQTLIVLLCAVDHYSDVVVHVSMLLFIRRARYFFKQSVRHTLFLNMNECINLQTLSNFLVGT